MFEVLGYKERDQGGVFLRNFVSYMHHLLRIELPFWHCLASGVGADRVTRVLGTHDVMEDLVKMLVHKRLVLRESMDRLLVSLVAGEQIQHHFILLVDGADVPRDEVAQVLALLDVPNRLAALLAHRAPARCALPLCCWGCSGLGGEACRLGAGMPQSRSRFLSPDNLAHLQLLLVQLPRSPPLLYRDLHLLLLLSLVALLQ